MNISGQTIAYQFTVSDVFDGITLAKNVVQSGDDDQFYTAEQAKAGVFPINDPSDEQPHTSRGNRWLTWLELRLEAPAPPGSTIEIVDNTSVEGSDVVLKQVANISGMSTVYMDAGILIPQGSIVRVIAAGRGIFRYHVTFLDPQGLALIASLAVSLQDDASSTYQVGNSADWAPPIPTTLGAGVDRLASAVASLLGGPIPG
jgi:hypothetical protein